MRLIVQVLSPSDTTPSSLDTSSHVSAVFQNPVRFALPVEPDQTFGQIWTLVEERYKRNYLTPTQAPNFVIEKIQDAYYCDLDMSDTVGAIFDGESNPEKIMIQVIPTSASRHLSLPPTSNLRPAAARKRFLDGLKSDANKRPRLEERSSLGAFQPDRPVTSRESVIEREGQVDDYRSEYQDLPHHPQSFNLSTTPEELESVSSPSQPVIVQDDAAVCPISSNNVDIVDPARQGSPNSGPPHTPERVKNPVQQPSSGSPMRGERLFSTVNEIREVQGEDLNPSEAPKSNSGPGESPPFARTHESSALKTHASEVYKMPSSDQRSKSPTSQGQPLNADEFDHVPHSTSSSTGKTKRWARVSAERRELYNAQRRAKRKERREAEQRREASILRQIKANDYRKTVAAKREYFTQVEANEAEVKSRERKLRMNEAEERRKLREGSGKASSIEAQAATYSASDQTTQAVNDQQQVGEATASAKTSHDGWRKKMDTYRTLPESTVEVAPKSIAESFPRSQDPPAGVEQLLVEARPSSQWESASTESSNGRVRNQKDGIDLSQRLQDEDHNSVDTATEGMREVTPAKGVSTTPGPIRRSVSFRAEPGTTDGQNEPCLPKIVINSPKGILRNPPAAKQAIKPTTTPKKATTTQQSLLNFKVEKGKGKVLGRSSSPHMEKVATSSSESDGSEYLFEESDDDDVRSGPSMSTKQKNSLHSRQQQQQSSNQRQEIKSKDCIAKGPPSSSPPETLLQATEVNSGTNPPPSSDLEESSQSLPHVSGALKSSSPSVASPCPAKVAPTIISSRTRVPPNRKSMFPTLTELSAQMLAAAKPPSKPFNAPATSVQGSNSAKVKGDDENSDDSSSESSSDETSSGSSSVDERTGNGRAKSGGLLNSMTRLLRNV
ncbi:hypothetical protein K432DRAFT_396330 [Lepidopterella palustris CBS 459.81]|uniref:Nucleolar protein Dnt1-like N-terminal domain-containing protein n=1 Tax=Lepidopterella palustris CBS 459.81 TaxID=1314670 RepID=A0A8E2E3K2_9PEZI|nr:hypothetical protein K432DRAFT_396330 [Lepidopterella palustris CBS 459.81]